MKHLAMVTLLSVAAPLSWGEEITFFCSTTHEIEISDYGSGLEVNDTSWPVFQLKVVINEAEETATVSGNMFGSGNIARTLDCGICMSDIDSFELLGRENIYIADSRLYYARVIPGSAFSAAGTCTKF